MTAFFLAPGIVAHPGVFVGAWEIFVVLFFDENKMYQALNIREFELWRASYEIQSTFYW